MLIAQESDDFFDLDPSSSDYYFNPSQTKKVFNQEMESVGIPKFLQESYVKGDPPPAINSLRNWQYELFSNEDWKSEKNCVVLVPTAGGKTVAAEVAIAQLLEKNPNAKALYCLPFVSLASEKYEEFKKRFRKFVVRPFFSNLGYEFNSGHIAVCTFEKAHTLINCAIKNNYISKIKLVIIDEIHMMGKPSRGATIEAIISKVKLLTNQPRIIGLSATLRHDDAFQLAKWLNGFCYQNASRPSCIAQYIKSPDGHLHKIQDGNFIQFGPKLESIHTDTNHILPLVADTIRQKPKNTVLIFVNSRKETRDISRLIATKLYSNEFLQKRHLPEPTPEVIEQRKLLIEKLKRVKDFDTDSLMEACILKGVCFHSAGLLLQERSLIEYGIKNGILNIIVATTTLSAGININSVSTVIIYNVFRKENFKNISLTPDQYNQMGGRAGRTSDNPGKVIIIQHKENEESNLIKELSKQEMGKLNSYLLNETEFDRYYLQCICFFPDSSDFIRQTYNYCSNLINEQEIEIRRIESIQRLTEKGLLINDKPTQLGIAISRVNLGIDEGLNLYDRVIRTTDLSIKDDLHLLYLCMPTDIGFRTPSYKDQKWDKIIDKHMHTIEIALHLSRIEIQKIFTLGYKENKKIDIELDRIYAAAIMFEMINETPLKDIEIMFEIDRGILQSLQQNSVTFSGQLMNFCELIGFFILAGALSGFRKRLELSVKNELLDLMQIPSCKKSYARLLYNVGITCVPTFAETECDKILNILFKNESKDQKDLVMSMLNEAQMIMENKRRIEEYENSLMLKRNLTEVNMEQI
ncbi:DEAD/DEAH box helicase family protein [Histomonas meleagridis]|uniref:DEAD/DEAH box helicase family protein n=1 Tax=Histomonas meleagridis TaxID=135588 RepID=UPI0035594CF7|nr:DEAD/DEAH box helicase family protein [Histomonas meleagridis]KAH0799453.1 DEAD/DEAH box helicase family protein [Histomonas meleagridis]